MSKYKSISKRILKSFVLFFIIFSITKLGYSYYEVYEVIIGNGEKKKSITVMKFIVNLILKKVGLLL